jgi:23S rRNA (cytidine2498-2'-O)-methyltransferase
LVAVERSIVAHCRSGFEAECVSDILRIATRARIEVACDAVAGSALVIASCGTLDNARWQTAMAATPPWFARSLFVGDGPHAFPERDRITPLLALAAQHQPPFHAIWLETPDTNEGKTRSGLCRRLSAPLTAAADHAGLLAPDDPRGLRLHVVFVDATRAWVGTSRAATGSPWPMGIPRLALPHSAPSRSALKLAEALLTFLTDDERLRLLKPGMRAVDLGAAPGGWTWQLAQRGLSVTAIDNGLLRGEVARGPLVEHLRADGLIWRPPRRLDGLRHRPATLAHRRARRRVGCGRRVQAHDLQPEAADEKALRRGRALRGSDRRCAVAPPLTPHAAIQAALPRP